MMSSPEHEKNSAHAERYSGPVGTAAVVEGARHLIMGPVEKMLRVRECEAKRDDVHGTRTSVMETGRWVLDLDDQPSSAAASVIMDSALSASIRSSAEECHGLVTTELHLNFVRDLPADGTTLESWVRTLVGDRTGGMATGALRGVDGTEYVQATGWFHGVEGRSAEELHEYRSSAKRLGTALDGRHLGELLGADSKSPDSPDTRPSIDDHFVKGLNFEHKELLRNSHGAVHGGALMIMASLAAQQAMPDRSRYGLQSLRAVYLRPATGALASRVRMRHVGRLLRVVDVELTGCDAESSGKAFVQATATFHVAP